MHVHTHLRPCILRTIGAIGAIAVLVVRCWKFASNHSAMQGARPSRPFQCSIPRPSRRACTGATVSMPATAQGSAGRFRFSIDRGGTFTDVFAEVCALPIPAVHLCIMALCLPCLSGNVCLNIPIGTCSSPRRTSWPSLVPCCMLYKGRRIAATVSSISCAVRPGQPGVRHTKMLPRWCARCLPRGVSVRTRCTAVPKSA